MRAPRLSAVATLGEPHLLAEVLARAQELHGGRQVAALTHDVGESRVQVRRAPQGGLALPCRKLQRLFVGLDRFAETSLRDPDVGQGDRCIHRVRDVAGSLHARHALGMDLMCRLEVAARPRRESQDRRRPTLVEVVALRCEIQDRPGVPDGCAATSPPICARTAR